MVADVSTLTDGSIGGTGAFDQVMCAFEQHIHQEFDRKRITGPEYSTVYLSGLQTMMQGAIQFLSEQANIALTQKNIELAAKNIELVTQQILVAEQDVLKGQKEVQLLAAQINKINQEITLIPKQRELIDKQIDDLAAGIKVKTQQIEKLKAEVKLTDAKTTSEKAQTSSAGVALNSVLGEQMNLYRAQTKGYATDAKIKVAGKMIDSWAVAMSTQDSADANTTNKLTDNYIGITVQNMIDDTAD